MTPWTATHQAPLSVEILQARLLEWVAVPSSRGSSQPKNQTCVSLASCIGRQVLYQDSAHELLKSKQIPKIGFSGGTNGKESACSIGDTRDLDSICGSGRSLGEGHGNPLEHSCLENFMDRGVWWAIAHGVAKSRTWLSTHYSQLPNSRYSKHPVTGKHFLY